MRTTGLLMLSAVLGCLCACRHEAVVYRSSIQLATVLRGEVTSAAGSSEVAVYVRLPVFRASNSEGVVFRMEPDQRHAVPVRVRFGDLATVKPGGTGDRAYVEAPTGAPNVEVVSGLRPGDEIILSDMSLFQEQSRIELR
jgi:hypothetical protein